MSSLTLERTTRYFNEEMELAVTSLYSVFRAHFRSGSQYPTHAQLFFTLRELGLEESLLSLLYRAPLESWFREYRLGNDSSRARIAMWTVELALIWFRLRKHYLKHNVHFHAIYRFYFMESLKPLFTQDVSLGREAAMVVNLLHMATLSYNVDYLKSRQVTKVRKSK